MKITELTATEDAVFSKEKTYRVHSPEHDTFTDIKAKSESEAITKAREKYGSDYKGNDVYAEIKDKGNLTEKSRVEEGYINDYCPKCKHKTASDYNDKCVLCGEKKEQPVKEVSEDATGGAVSSGAIAAVPLALGKNKVIKRKQNETKKPVNELASPRGYDVVDSEGKRRFFTPDEEKAKAFASKHGMKVRPKFAPATTKKPGVIPIAAESREYNGAKEIIESVMAEEEQVDELSVDAYKNYIQGVFNHAQKKDTDPTKRDPRKLEKSISVVDKAVDKYKEKKRQEQPAVQTEGEDSGWTSLGQWQNNDGSTCSLEKGDSGDYRVVGANGEELASGPISAAYKYLKTNCQPMLPGEKVEEESQWEEDTRGLDEKGDGALDESDDELNARPGAWRGAADMSKRLKKDGTPTKHEKGMQDNLKARIKMTAKTGGLTGPEGNLPEGAELDEGVVDNIKKAVHHYKNQSKANDKGWGQLGRALSAADEKEAKQAIRNSNRYRDFAKGGTGFKSTKEEVELTEGHNHLVGKYKKNGFVCHLWNDGNYLYNLTTLIDGVPKNVKVWNNKRLEDVQDQLAQLGYQDLSASLGEGKEEQKNSALRKQIDDLEQRAKRASPLKKELMMKQAKELRLQLPVTEESQLNEYIPKPVPTHLKSGKPNPNHPHFEKHQAEYVRQRDADKAAARAAAKAARPAPAPRKTSPSKKKITTFLSSRPNTPLEKTAKSAMYDVWNAIAPDVMSGMSLIDPHNGQGSTPDLDPYEIAEWCTDANRLQQFAELTPEEEQAVLSLGRKTLARLASDFGF